MLSNREDTASARPTRGLRHARATLDAVHHQVARLLRQFASAPFDQRRLLAAEICAELRASQPYAQPLGYPSFLQSGYFGRYAGRTERGMVGARELVETIERWPAQAPGITAPMELLAHMVERYLKEWWGPRLDAPPRGSDATDDIARPASSASLQWKA
jgi:hypothetical protein